MIQRHGANVESRDNDGCTALMLAAENGHASTMRQLINDHGANVNAVDDNGWTAMTHAAENGHNYREMMLDDYTLRRLLMMRRRQGRHFGIPEDMHDD